MNEEINLVTEAIIGAGIAVHSELGAGLLESAYTQCLTIELRHRGLQVECQKPVRLSYKGMPIDYSYRIDLVVNDSVVVEVKSVDHLLRVHEAQTLTYMRLVNCRIGLLLNFNVSYLVQGIRRLILDFPENKRADAEASALALTAEQSIRTRSNPARDV